MDETTQLATLVGSIAGSLVVVAHNSLCNQSSKVVIGVPADTLDSDSNVSGAHGVITDANVGADKVSLDLGLKIGRVLDARSGKSGKVLLGKLDDLLVGDTTRVDQDHAVSRVVVLDVVGELGTGDVADVFTWAEDRATEGLVLESSGMKVIKDDLLNLLLDLFRLAEDDITLALDSGGLELGVLQDIGDDIDALGNVGVEGFGKVDGVLTLETLKSVWKTNFVAQITAYRCVRVEVTTHVLNLQFELLLRPFGGTLVVVSLKHQDQAMNQSLP